MTEGQSFGQHNNCLGLILDLGRIGWETIVDDDILLLLFGFPSLNLCTSSPNGLYYIFTPLFKLLINDIYVYLNLDF